MNRFSASNSRVLVVAATVVFMVLGALMAWPEPDVRLLVPADGWETTGSFVTTEAPLKDLRSSAALDPENRYWRSWNPDTGSQPGTLRSRPFEAKGFIAVPYNGFAGEAGVATYLECADSGQREYLATSRNTNQWSEVFVKPSDFCAGRVRVVAESTSTQNFVALGTPYEVSLLSVFKQSTLPSLWFLVLAWAVVGGWFLIFAELAYRKARNLDSLAIGLIGIGLAGYLMFFVYWFLPGLGRLLSWLLVLAGIGSILFRYGSVAPSPAIARIRAAVALWLLIAAAYLMLGLAGDDGTGAWAMNGRFAPARWSTDNQLPGFVARMLVSGDHQLDSGDFGPWTVADRPPLVYGWHAAIHAVLKSVIGSEWRPLFHLYQLAVGVAVNSSWTLALALLLPRLGLSRFKSLLLITVLVLSPFLIFNDLFVWPKLLSASFAFTAAWMLLGMDRGASSLRDDNTGLVMAAILCALALLTHGGSLFGIVIAIGMAAMYRGLPSLKGGALAASVALALLFPWSLWQSQVQPPGNALIKYAFGGTFGFGEEQIGVVDTLLRSYHQLGFDGWIAAKRNGLLTLLFGIRNTCGAQEMGTAYSLVDRLRGSDFFYVLPSFNFLLLGFMGIATAWMRRSMAIRGANKLVLFGVATVALSFLTTWDCFINHHQSYQAMLALHLGLALALLGAGRWGQIALALSVAYGLVVWVFEPMNHLPRFDYVAIAVLAGCALLWLLQLRSARLGDSEPLP